MPKAFKWYYGTKLGGIKAAETNRRLHGENFYAEIGRKGGVNSSDGGFASCKVGPDGLTGPQRARLVGAKGGKNSRRGPDKKKRVVQNRASMSKKVSQIKDNAAKSKRKFRWPWSK